MSSRSYRTWSIVLVAVIAACGRSRATRDDEGAGDDADQGGRSGRGGASSGGFSGSGTTGGAPEDGGAGGDERGGTSNAGAGDGGQGPDCDLDGDGVLSPRCGGEDCEDDDPTLPDPNDSNATTGSFRTQAIAELRGGAGLAVDPDGAVHVAVAMHGHVRYLVNGELKHVLLADVQPSSEVRLALDSRGEPRILFGGLGSPIGLAVQSEGSWRTRQLDSDGLPVSIVLGPNGETIFGYIEDPLAGQRLHLMGGYGIDLGFDHTLQGPTNAALAMGPDGELHVVWHDANGALEYSVIDLDTKRVESESVPTELAAPPVGLSVSGLAVNRAGVPGLGVIVEDVLVHLVRDPVWRRVEIPSPLYPEPPLLASDQAGFMHLFLSDGGIGLTYLSDGPDGWAEAEFSSIGPPKAFALDAFGVGHAVVESSAGMSLGERAYVTNRDLVPDSVDRNCDGVDGFDRDSDGHASIVTGGDDCNDHDPEINPDVEDLHGDGVDSDCNGFNFCPKGLPGPAFVEVPYGNRSFCMDATEVTNADYAVFLASGVPTEPSVYTHSSCAFNSSFEPAPLGAPAAFDGTCPGFLPETRSPLTCVDWCDAWAYCAWAGKRLCGASFGLPITEPSESVWRIACDSGLMGIGDFGAVWEWQDGCTLGPSTTGASDPCPAYGGELTTAPPPDRCNESISLARSDVSDIVGFRCCDL